MEALYIHIATKLEKIRFGDSPAAGVIGLGEIKSPALWRAVLAEFLAQLLFVFLGVMSAMTIGLYKGDTLGDIGDGARLVKISFAFGLAIMALVQMFGHVSGGHINPAVSIAMAVSMNISLVRCVLYVLAQVLGAMAGGFVVSGVSPNNITDHHKFAVTGLAPNVTPAQGFVIEMILTFCLLMVIYGTTDGNRASFGSPSLLIGLTVTLGHLAGIDHTGASMNPSRSLGSAIAAGVWTNHWIYWIAPITGGVLAAVVYKYVISPYRGTTDMAAALEQMKADSPPGARTEDISLKNVA